MNVKAAMQDETAKILEFIRMITPNDRLEEHRGTVLERQTSAGLICRCPVRRSTKELTISRTAVELGFTKPEPKIQAVGRSS